MRKVKSSGNHSTEIKLIQMFREYKIIGWRRKYKLFGNPDFAFPAQKTAVFADGCFWHGHNCRNVKPSTNSDYWNKKIQGNMIRDKKTTQALKKLGWKVVRIWECEIKRGERRKFRSLAR